VQVTVGGQPAPIVSHTGGYINAQVPAGTSSGNTDVVVSLNSQGRWTTLSPVRSQVAAISPSLFTTDWTHLAAMVGDKRVTPEAPAKPGDTVSLYGTGCGATDPALADGEIPKTKAPLAGPVVVSVAGTALPAGDVLFAGSAVGQPGVCQFDIKLPATVADGDIPVSVRVAGQASQSGTVLIVKR
jgi:uncharacterized protein (TIGR03437 family)